MPQRRRGRAALSGAFSGLEAGLLALLQNQLIGERQEESDSRRFDAQQARDEELAAERARTTEAANQFNLQGQGFSTIEEAAEHFRQQRELTEEQRVRGLQDKAAELRGGFGQTFADQSPENRPARDAAIAAINPGANFQQEAADAFAATTPTTTMDPSLATPTSGGTAAQQAGPVPGIPESQVRANEVDQAVSLHEQTQPSLDRIAAEAEARASGTAAGTPQTLGAPTAAQDKARGFLLRASEADKALRGMTEDANFMGSMFGLDERMVVSGVTSFGRDFMDQREEFVRAVLRLESGGAITSDEKDDLLGTVPETGDTHENIATKQGIRDNILDGIAIQAGVDRNAPVDPTALGVGDVDASDPIIQSMIAKGLIDPSLVR